MLEVKSKGVPNEDFIQGYPGIPATWPRLAGTVEVRIHPPNNKDTVQPIDIKKVTVASFRTDSIVIPSHRPSLAAQKRDKSFLVTREKTIYLPSTSDTPPVYALDVPFTLSSPPQLTASISLPKTLESLYHALVRVTVIDPTTSSPQETNYQFPVRLKKFDTLATFGTFSQPLHDEVVSADHLVSLEWALPISAYGPGDLITLAVRTPPNADWPKSKKVKLKRVSLELVQMTKYFIPKPEDPEGGSGSADTAANQPPATTSSTQQPEEEEIETRTRISKVSKEFTSTEQNDRKGMEKYEQLELLIPSVFKNAESGILTKESPEVGYEGRSAFTNSSSLYSIEFESVLHARFSHAKDIEARQPITMSQFDHTACSIYMQNIVGTAQKLKRLSNRTPAPSVWVEPLDPKVRIG